MVKVLKVLKPEAGSGSVDKSKPFDLHNMIPCKNDSPPLLPKQLALYDDHHVVFCITRSKNDNTVVYRARTNDNKFVESDAIEVYWMGFSRKDPHEVDPSKLRDDLNWMEKKMAYGATATKDHRGEPDEFEVKLVAVPHLKVTMKKDATGRPRLYAVVGERNCFIVRVYVLAKENMIGLPKVIHVNIHGIDIETGEEIVEQITP